MKAAATGAGALRGGTSPSLPLGPSSSERHAPASYSWAPPHLSLLNFSHAAAARSPASPDTSDHSSSASPTPGHSSLSAPYCPARSLDQPPHRRLSSVTMHSGYPAPCPVHVFCIHSKYTFLKISGLLLLLLIHSYLFPGESKLLKARAVVSC